MRNIKITLSYDGTDFHGWQTQPNARTVQETLESALAQLTGEKIRVNASGRTDAGVHALGQVANFRSESRIPVEKLADAINSQLPDDVAVHSAAEMSAEFDANRDAVRKLYRYVIHNAPTPSPFLRKYACQVKRPLDVEAMAKAAQALKGTHDFHSFETEWPNRKSSVRTITHISINRAGAYIWLDVEADGFLYNMVRAIAGTLMEVGRGYWPVEKVAAILAAQDRTQARPTAPAHGLFLVRVVYV